MGSGEILKGVVRRLRSQFGEPPTDLELLASYAQRHDEAAFAALVRRHGALVFGVARRQLADRQLAEDVFQATFLALARSAARLGRPAGVAGQLAVHRRPAAGSQGPASGGAAGGARAEADAPARPAGRPAGGDQRPRAGPADRRGAGPPAGGVPAAAAALRRAGAVA